jgi:predicted nucleotidyltransferase
MEEHLRPALHKAIQFLDEMGYRYAIIGGVALAQWGVARYTHDIDLKILIPDLEYDQARANLHAAFPMRARTQGPQDALIMAVNIDGVVVDFIFAVHGYDELVIERAGQRDLGGWSAWICSAEDLIIQKASAGRGKDWPDIEALLIEQHGKLDYDYIEDWLQQFAEALENPELLQEYHHLRERVESLR